MDTNLQNHYKPVMRILICVLLLNWLVALAKILYGLFSHCASMTADGFHSLSDGASNIIGLVGIHIASKPVDKDHPYGHRKYETFFSLGIAALLFFLCFNLVYEGTSRLFRPVTPQINIISFVIMAVTIAINFVVMKYEHKRGIQLKSDILVSDSKHTRADMLTSLSVIFALVAIKLGYPILDPIATLIIALLIGYAGFEIVKSSSDILCDSSAIVDNKRITDIVMAVKGVKACHKIRSRGRPDDIHIDLHVQVRPDMHMDEAHRISYTIEETIKKGIPEVADVIVHMEPKEKAGQKPKSLSV